MIKLFISYRSLDSAKVDKYILQLTSLKNTDNTPRYYIWQDKHRITAGQDWWQAIVRGIIDCDIFVFMISKESVQNINCRDELTYAYRRNRPIIPFVLEGEYLYSPAKGKNDVEYWQHMPSELTDNRFQLLFYEGAGFADELNRAVHRLMALGMKDIPVLFPPDPRDKTSNDTSTIYDQACEYAYRLDFDAARTKFRRLVDWQDDRFGDIAHEWLIILSKYEEIIQLDNLKHTRFQIPTLWAEYKKLFPKQFIEGGIFDPKEFQNRYSNAASEQTVEKEHLKPIKPKTNSSYIQDASSTSNLSLQPEPSTLVVKKPKPASQHRNPVEIAHTFKGKRNSSWKPIIETFEVKGVKMEMCLVPLGTFQMGSDDAEVEMPIHPQRLLQPYWIGVHPVTNAQWRMAVSKSTRVTVPEWDVRYKVKNAANHPVVGVTYYQCMEFVKWLGDEWSLPTEPEWEYAARGIDNLLYPFGKRFQPDIVVYSANSNKRTEEIGGRANNVSWVGAEDMSGNVWEWMRSRYREGKYNGDDGREEISKFSECVLRGGSWTSNEAFLRTVSRSRLYPIDKRNDVGFRCVRSI